MIRSDQRSLKELLSQVVQTPDQQFYIRKLMDFKFRIEYKSGTSNRVADALSRRDPDKRCGEASTLALFARSLEMIRTENARLPDLVLLHQSVANNSSPPHLSVIDGLLYFKRRIYLSRDSCVRNDVMEESHSANMAGHPSEKHTFARVAASFYWPGMRTDVRQFVAAVRSAMQRSALPTDHLDCCSPFRYPIQCGRLPLWIL